MSDPREATSPQRLGRRAFLRGGTLLLAGAGLAACDPSQLLAAADDARPKLRVGLITDLHYADKPQRGTRFYRDTLVKLAEAAKRFDEEKPDAVIALGDLIDSAPSLDAEKDFLRRIAKEFSHMPGKRHFVLGNHCVENLTKPEFLAIVGQERSYYSFDEAGIHFVILDACFTSGAAPYGRKNFQWGDAKLPPDELQWLREDLLKTPNKCIVCVHQCLDLLPPYGVKNALEVRKIFEESGKVLAVLQGHYHYGNYVEFHGIHYCTISAVIEGAAPENNAYAMLDLLGGGSLRITGFRKQRSYQWGGKS